MRRARPGRPGPRRPLLSFRAFFLLIAILLSELYYFLCDLFSEELSYRLHYSAELLMLAVAKGVSLSLRVLCAAALRLGQRSVKSLVSDHQDSGASRWRWG